MILLVTSSIFITFLGQGNAIFEAVTFHPRVELYYSHLLKRAVVERSQDQNIPSDNVDAPRVRLDVNTKTSMCHDIFTSGYFDLFNEEPIGPEQAFAELKTNHKHVFSKVLRLESSFAIDTSEMTHLTDTRWVKNIMVPTNSDHTQYSGVNDYVFTCLTQHRVTKRTTVYFISDRLNVALDAPISKADGHFILCLGVEDEIRVKAIVEEPARAIVTDLETRYLSYRKFDAIARNEEDDPLCRLGILHKNRVCSVVLNSSFFKGKIKFWPHEDLLNPKCEKMKISFRTEAVKKKIKYTFRTYKEWMLRCPAVPISGDGRSFYLVSRASRSGEAFVYSQNDSSKEIYLENLSEGVSSISLSYYEYNRTFSITGL